MNVQRSRFQCRIFVDFGTAVGGGFCYTGEAGKHKFREDELDMETKQKEKKKENRFSFLYILGGGILKEDFIVRHTKMIVLVVVLIFIFIGNRYVCMQRLREIDRLQQQLRDVRFEALSISSELTGNSRQSQIELLIEEQGIELEAAKNPPYELYK